MKRTIIALVALLAAGCNSPFPGFRFAPSEPEKQSAQTADDLAAGADSVGYRPGSAAAATLAKSTGPMRTRAGEPKNPVNVGPLIDAERGAWQTKQAQTDAWKLKEGLYARTGRITSAAMADLTELVQTKGKVAASEIIHRVSAICEFQKMTADFTRRIPVPKDRKISAEEQARLDALTEATDRIVAAATEQAARRPTIGEVAEKAEDEALGAIDRVGSILESYGLLALIPGAGGVYYAAKKRKAAKTAQAEADTARHDEANARHAAEMVKADAAEVVSKAMDRLAAAQPPKNESAANTANKET